MSRLHLLCHIKNGPLSPFFWIIRFAQPSAVQRARRFCPAFGNDGDRFTQASYVGTAKHLKIKYSDPIDSV